MTQATKRKAEGAIAAQGRKLAQHIVAMKDASYHSWWTGLVKEAEALLAKKGKT